jgi:hypothetical protein
LKIKVEADKRLVNSRGIIVVRKQLYCKVQEYFIYLGMAVWHLPVITKEKTGVESW